MSRDIFELSSDFVDELARLQPSEATFSGIAGHNGRWDDFSAEGLAELSAALKRARKRFEAAEVGTDPWAQLAQKVALDYCDREQLRFVDDDHLAQLNNMASPFQSLTRVFDAMGSETASDWADIASRLEGLDAAASSYQRLLEAGRSKGKTAARRQVEAVILQGRMLSGSSSSINRLVGVFNGSGIDDATLKRRVEQGARTAVAAMTSLTDYLENVYLPHARVDDAVGAARYARATKSFLGSDIDLRETYAWGWTQVQSLRAEMKTCAKAIKPGASIDEVLEILKTDPARSADRERFIELMQERQKTALAALDGSHFDVPEVIRAVDVKMAPPGGALGAYYMPPSEDFKRSGCVWYSPGDNEVLPLYDQVSTAYHEGFPGHHLQCGIQVALADRLSRLHRFFYWYSGYGEGWALYTERLMQELGYYDKPDYVFGMLANEMLRACRVVIDIGSHLKLPIPADQEFHGGEAWTFETAVEMLMSYGTMAEDYAKSEVTRYLGWPGQAISYKVGQRAILELRAELQARHRAKGTELDLKAFHNTVLGSGPLSLDMLREIVLAE